MSGDDVLTFYALWRGVAPETRLALEQTVMIYLSIKTGDYSICIFEDQTFGNCATLQLSEKPGHFNVLSRSEEIGSAADRTGNLT